MGESGTADSWRTEAARTGEAGCVRRRDSDRKNGKPVARLTRLSNRKGSALIGAFAGKLHMAEDFDATPAEFEPYL